MGEEDMTFTTQRPSRTRSNGTGGGTGGGAPVCCSCGQPIQAGDPHWAGDTSDRAWHYGCAERAGITLSWTRPHRGAALNVGR